MLKIIEKAPLYSCEILEKQSKSDLQRITINNKLGIGFLVAATSTTSVHFLRSPKMFFLLRNCVLRSLITVQLPQPRLQFWRSPKMYPWLPFMHRHLFLPFLLQALSSRPLFIFMHKHISILRYYINHICSYLLFGLRLLLDP